MNAAPAVPAVYGLLAEFEQAGRRARRRPATPMHKVIG